VLDARRKAYLQAMGLTLWVRRDLPVTETETEASPGDSLPERVPASPPSVESNAGSAVTRELAGGDWEHLSRQVASCTACALHESRTQTVFGVGDPQADLMIVGEAPGAEEDRQGEPFVGRAGQLLTAMLAAIGLERRHVYIANILKCRPPGNRNPSPAEVACCLPFLERQVALVKPRLILSVGAVSAQNLLGTAEPVGRLRGHVHTFGAASVPVIVSYHPAYLLRQPAEKAKAWQDLQTVKRMLDAV